MRKLFTLSIIVLILSACFTTLSARTWYIMPDGTGDAPTIQAGIDSAAAGDTVLLANGTFTGDGNKTIEYHGKAITVRSEEGEPDSCIIDIEGSGLGFIFRSDDVSGPKLEGISIKNGFTMFGGAIWCENGAAPTFINCKFLSNNVANSGGAIICVYSSPTLMRCRFSNNSAGPYGGAMACINSTPTLIFCTFYDNSSQYYSGAIHCYASTKAIINNCMFSANSADDRGGAISCDSSSCVTMFCCTFSGNSAEYGGGLYCMRQSVALLDRCTFYGNSANYGGGLACDSSSVNLMNTIITFCTSGEAIYCGTESYAYLLKCNDIYGNAGGDYVGCLAGQNGIEGNISLDPLFCDLENENFRLQEDSPCAPFTSPNPDCDLIGAWPVGCIPTGVNDLMQIPSVYVLHQNYPNPFNPHTTIIYSIPRMSHTTLKIYDVSGSLVRVLISGLMEAGVHREIWDGRDDHGREVSSGVYFYRLRVGSYTDTKKLVLLR